MNITTCNLGILMLVLTVGQVVAGRPRHCELIAEGLRFEQPIFARRAGKSAFLAVEGGKLREFSIKDGKLIGRDLLNREKIEFVNVSPTGATALVCDKKSEEFILLDLPKARVRWSRALSGFSRREANGAQGVSSACWNQPETAILVSLYYGPTVLIDAANGSSKNFIEPPKGVRFAISSFAGRDDLAVIADEHLGVNTYRLSDGIQMNSTEIPGPRGDVIGTPSVLRFNDDTLLIDDVLSGDIFSFRPRAQKTGLQLLKFEEGWSRTEIAFDGGRRLAFGYRQKVHLYSTSIAKTDTIECLRWSDRTMVKQVVWFGRDLLVLDSNGGLVLVSLDDL